jgi:hypothetical protein
VYRILRLLGRSSSGDSDAEEWVTLHVCCSGQGPVADSNAPWGSTKDREFFGCLKCYPLANRNLLPEANLFIPAVG